MQTCKTLEYLFYLALFVLYFKLAESASIDTINISTTSITSPSAKDVLTTTARSMTNRGSVRNVEGGSKLKRTLEECNSSFSWMCLKLEFVRILERLTEREELRLLNGISVVKDPEAKEIKTSELMAEVARSYPNDPDARLNGYIINKVNNFLQTHYLRFKLIDDHTIEEARSLVETGRKDKFGKKGGMEALIAAGLMMKGTLMAMGMGGIALIAGKALMTALMALTLAAVVGLKSLAGGGGKSHTYEIVTKPIYTSSHSHSVSHEDGGHGGHMGHSGSGYGGYARSLNLSLPKSLRASAKVH
ncbi:uncharacterized protein LOC119605938 [Lucilia sericata]|uniref:uncharacterized protein LOC119605938 n=1 Tax=Lucilia sericata TaxID=13632 RepID=UPI0018A82CE6|nr:uncharacterized protein LOC119605938 [Lucilia sericata]